MNTDGSGYLYPTTSNDVYISISDDPGVNFNGYIWTHGGCNDLRNGAQSNWHFSGNNELNDANTIHYLVKVDRRRISTP